MDVALRLEQLVSGAVYNGSLTENTQKAYDRIDWADGRQKPTWAEIQAAPEPKSIAELYGAMSLSEQSKYEDYIVRGDFYLKYGNLPKVQEKYTLAFAKFNPVSASDEEKAFITGVQQLLGVKP